MPGAKVAHVINSIGLGGVPEAAYQLLRTLPPDFDKRLLVLRPLGHFPEPGRAERLQRFQDIGLAAEFVTGTNELDTVGGIARWLTENRIDILHTHSYRPNLLARLAGSLCRDTGLRIIAHYHNQYDANWEKHGTLELDRGLAAITDHALVCSNDVGQHLIERIGALEGRITVIPNGVELHRFEAAQDQAEARRALGLPHDRPIIGLVGRLSRQKGQDTLVRAAAHLRRSYPEVLVTLAGAPDSSDQIPMLEALARELGLTASLRILGFVSDIRRFYAAADVIAAPSRWEGFGLMLVEAMAAGRPIVAARAGAIPEVAGPDGAVMLVPPDDPESLAGAISAVLSNAELSERMRRLGLTRAREFQWERSSSLLSDVYSGLLRRRSA